MVKAASVPLLPFMLMMMLVVVAGTAWFAALHPRLVWQLLQDETGEGTVDEELAAMASVFQRIRLSGFIVGAAVSLLLLLTDG